VDRLTAGRVVTTQVRHLTLIPHYLYCHHNLPAHHSRTMRDKPPPKTWLVDSGATDHMTPFNYKFLEYRRHRVQVTTAAGKKIFSKGIGHIHTTFQGTPITISDVLHVPDLKESLLSTAKITDKDLEVSFRKTDVVIRNKDGSIQVHGYREDRSYFFKEEFSISNSPPQVLAVTSADVDIWHMRLGHVNTKATNILLKRNLGPTFCETCAVGKIKSLPFPKHSRDRSSHILQLIHTDIAGPITPPTPDGKRYIMTFIDDKSRLNEIKLLNNKSEALSCFQEYQIKMEKQLGEKIKILRSDNGGEYINKAFSRYLSEHGIIHQLTIPYCPQQNGVAERFNQTLINMARCMLIGSNLPTAFWGESTITASYILNHCPSSALHFKSPLEAWSNQEHPIDHLRVFGCKVWVKIKTHTNKFDPRGLPGYLMGYTSRAKGYKVWIPSQRRFIATRDLIFNEREFNPGLKRTETLTIQQPPCHQDNTTSETLLNPILRASWSFDEEPIPNALEPNIPVPQQEQIPPQFLDQHQIGNEVEPLLPEMQPLQPILENNRPLRTKRPPEKLKDYVLSARTPATKFPKSLTEALMCEQRDEWKSAAVKELKTLLRNKTWELCPRDPNRKCIKSMWTFTMKTDDQGVPAKFKARLVAMGNTQVEGSDYQETYSPVIHRKSLRILTNIAASKNWDIHHMDVTGAYLQADIDREILMELPPGMITLYDELVEEFPETPNLQRINRERLVCKLKKSLYGLHQSGKLWNTMINEAIISTGFTRSVADPCIYFFPGRPIIIGVYVDDLFFFGETSEIIKAKANLKRLFPCTDSGSCKNMLSIHLSQNVDTVTMDQTAYIESLLKDFRMNLAKPSPSPMASGVTWTKTAPGDELPDDLSALFSKGVGCLLYLASTTRPDISFVATSLSQFSRNPSKAHWEGFRHVLKYLKGTKDLGITYHKKTTGEAPNISCFADADWGSNPVDRKSFSGFLVLVNDQIVSWCTRKQASVATSTVEAEMVAMSEAVKECTWTRNFLIELGLLTHTSGSKLLVDNQGAIHLASNHYTSNKSKHIDLKVFHVRDKVDDKEILLEYVPTKDNLADSLTKVIPGVRLNTHLRKLSMLGDEGSRNKEEDRKGEGC
jgi:hypothetical protein